jgi:salicylate hydroxylase
MPGTGRTFVIAGAGISGLTLALALAERGATVVVLERSPVLQQFGAGLQISPNARHILNRLGLDEAIAGLSLEPACLDTYPEGRESPLISLELGQVVRDHFGAPYAVMHRADLADLLHNHCRRFDNIDIKFGVGSWSVTSNGDGVAVTLHGSGDHGSLIRATALIGADGVHSPTRRTLLGGPQAAFGGRVAWRNLVSADSVAGQLPRDRVSVFFGSGFHLVCYPLPHRNEVNLALFLPGSLNEPKAQPRLARPGARVGGILHAAGEHWTPWPLYTVQTPTWHKGNVGLIGDAAHAMVPFQAQGAAMGIEDAAVLAPLLLETKSPEDAFQRYAQSRQQRVRRVAALSAQNGRIFHMPWPLSLARDAVMAAQGPRAHLQRLNWVYGYRTTETLA